MKTTKFYFFILSFLLFHHLQAQEMQCGTMSTESDRQEKLRRIGLSHSRNLGIC